MEILYSLAMVFINFILLISFCYSITDLDLSDRIIIDGYSDDFTLDEQLLSDDLGNQLESPSDSYWGEYNDVKQIKATWDEQYLYIGVDACSWDNNVMLFIDVNDNYGIQDMSEMNAWQRSFKFYNINPDFFAGTWDTNDTPQFWQVQYGGSLELVQIQSIESYSTFDTGSLNRSMELKIPWDLLRLNGNSINTIKLLSVITSGDDYSSSPDAAPDNLGGMSNTSQMVVLDNYIEILVDSDSDENPDIGVSPQLRTSFYKKPPFDPVALSISNVIFETSKVFAPFRNQKVQFTLETNRATQFSVKIFDLNGKYINEAEQNSGILNWSWNGKDRNGNIVPFGIYILRFLSDSGELSHKEAVVVIK